MGNVIHRAALNHPLPLVRDNSLVEPSRIYGGWVLCTDFGDGYRVVFFGDDREDLLRRLGEAGPVVHDGDKWFVSVFDGLRECDECGLRTDAGEYPDWINGVCEHCDPSILDHPENLERIQ